MVVYTPDALKLGPVCLGHPWQFVGMTTRHLTQNLILSFGNLFKLVEKLSNNHRKTDNDAYSRFLLEAFLVCISYQAQKPKQVLHTWVLVYHISCKKAMTLKLVLILDPLYKPRKFPYFFICKQSHFYSFISLDDTFYYIIFYKRNPL